MEERILKKTAVFIAVISAAACLSVPYFPRIRDASEEMLTAFWEYRTKTKAQRLNMTGLELIEYNNEQAKQEFGEMPSFSSQIRLKLPLGVSGKDVTGRMDYLTRTFELEMPYAGEDYLYDCPVLGDAKHLLEFTYRYQGHCGTVSFITKKVCEAKTSYDEDYYYIDFMTPKELYDHVAVVDVGCGGDVAGIEKRGVSEKNVNLDIALELKGILEKEGDSVGVYFTRTEDVSLGKESREELVELSGAELLIGIRCNSTQSGRMSSINGTQVAYGGSGKGAKRLAEICLEEVTALAQSSNKGLVAGGELTCDVPYALIKVGFMTNQEELALLCSKEYQHKAAQGIYQAIIKAFEEGL